MKDNDIADKEEQKFVIQTNKGEVEISWQGNQRPGFCPHCHKCIPLSSIVFKKETENGAETYSGMDAVRTLKHSRLNEDSMNDNHSRIGECPYCHKKIPMREIVFKKQ